MNNFHIKNFIKCGFLNNFLLVLISNYYNNSSSAEQDYIIFFFLKILKIKSSTINFNNYKFCLCFSIDNIICHGIPIFEKINIILLKIDISINYKKLHSDSCLNIFLKEKKFSFIKKFFFNVLEKIEKNKYYSNISVFFLKLKKYNLYTIKEYCSHGIFLKLHNKNIILHNINIKKKIIKNLDSFTIEPMFSYYKYNGKNLLGIFFNKNKKIIFQWEHTLNIFNNKKILTTLRKTELCFFFQ